MCLKVFDLFSLGILARGLTRRGRMWLKGSRYSTFGSFKFYRRPLTDDLADGVAGSVVGVLLVGRVRYHLFQSPQGLCLKRESEGRRKTNENILGAQLDLRRMEWWSGEADRGKSEYMASVRMRGGWAFSWYVRTFERSGA